MAVCSETITVLRLDGLLAADVAATRRDITSQSEHSILIGAAESADLELLAPVLDALDLTLVTERTGAVVPRTCIAVDDCAAAADLLSAATSRAPRAARVIVDLMRQSTGRPPWQALYAESIAYSELLAGPEFAAWRTATPAAADPGPAEPPVLSERLGDVLTVTINRPERRNALSRWVRDAMCDALDLAVLDPSIREVRVTGNGPAFCSGGDLDEFGSQTDIAAAHFVRMERSVGWRIHLLAERVVTEVHGACVGAGAELPAFGGRVEAREDSWFQLPELAMGLLPGAGGTVSLPRRIGRWRASWMALSATRIDLATALDWGLVDRRVP
jgi:enoyl-CoA hydratase/carnithine racemase